MTQEEKHLIDRYIDNSLTGVELRDFIDKLETDEEFKKKVSFHNLLIEGILEAEVIRLTGLIEKSLRYKKPVVPFALKLIVTFLFVTMGGIVLWNYIGPGSSGEKHNYFIMDLFRNKKEIQNDFPAAGLTVNEKSGIRNNQLSNDSISDFNESTEKYNSKNENLPIGPDIVVKKDQLVVTYDLKPIEIGDDIAALKNAGEPVTSLNTDILVAESELPDQSDIIGNYSVEFWVSPVNYRGYKLVNDKLILFGIDRPDAVVLYSGNNKLWMKYDNDYFYLEPGEYFESLVVLNEIPSEIK